MIAGVLAPTMLTAVNFVPVIAGSIATAPYPLSTTQPGRFADPAGAGSGERPPYSPNSSA